MNTRIEWRVQGRAQWAGCLGFVICPMIGSGFFPAPALADNPIRNQVLQIEAPGFVWSELQELKLFEVPVYLRRFAVAAPVDVAARILAGNTRLFQETQASRQKIMLSGARADSHWVAEIAATQDGAQGSVSALSLSLGHLNKALSRRSNLLASWVPQPAQLRFSEMSVVDGQALRQQIYLVARPLDELNAQLREHLQALGWRDVSADERPPAGRVWRLNRERLVLVSAATAGASTLFVQHFQ